MPQFQKRCVECGEPLSAKRLAVMPEATLCVGCADQPTQACKAIAPPKPIASKAVVTTFHLKRYLANVGQKSDERVLFRTLVRLCYLFPYISVAEVIPILINWNKVTSSPFGQEQLRSLFLDAKQWVLEHPSRKA
jgi:hypothetical protein